MKQFRKTFSPKSPSRLSPEAKDARLLHADSKDSDQTGQMPRLIRVSSGHTGHFVGFVMPQLYFLRKIGSQLFKINDHMSSLAIIN